MSDTNHLIYSFKEHLKILNRSTATIEAYTDNVKGFLETIDDVKKVSKEMIEDYIANLYYHKTKDNKPYQLNTIILKIRSIKRFFEFLEKTNVIFINPAEFIKEPKKEKRLPRTILTDKEVKLILNQPNLSTRVGIRDRAILELFYSTGIRLNELCSLSIYDADLQGQMVRINQGKGKKDRVVPMGKHAVKSLREYISQVRPHLSRKNKSIRTLFVDYYGKPLSKQMVAIMVKTYARKAGIKKQVTAHTLRHTFATTLINNGANIVAVQKMLGHVELKTTQGYIQSLGLDIKKVHRKTHPREKQMKGQGSGVKGQVKTIKK